MCAHASSLGCAQVPIAAIVRAKLLTAPNDANPKQRGLIDYLNPFHFMKIVANFKLLALLVAVTATVFTGCKKDLPGDRGPSDSDAVTQNGSRDGGAFEEEDCEDFPECFTINYPVSVVMPDGTQQSAADDDALYNLFDGLDDEDDLAFVYPISITLEDDGSTQSIASDDDFDAVMADCFGDDWDDDFACDEEDWEEWPECFELHYPITVTMPDGSDVVLTDDDDLDELFDALDDAEEDDLDLVIHYPICVTMEETGDVETIGNDDELEELFEWCFDEWDDEYGCDEDDLDDFEDCFTLNYPVDVTLPDGSTTSVATDDDWDPLFDQLDEYDDIEVVYPVTITMTDDGTTQTINSDDEFDAALDDCE